MPKKVNWIPEGYHTLTPYLAIRDAARAIEFYKKAFGAEEVTRMHWPNGTVMHAEMKIGDSFFMLGEESVEMGSPSPQTLKGTTQGVFMYVKDVDAAFKRAVDAGAKVTMELGDMFWGDRYGKLEDPFGHSWALATHKEDLTAAEIHKRTEAFLRGHK